MTICVVTLENLFELQFLSSPLLILNVLSNILSFTCDLPQKNFYDCVQQEYVQKKDPTSAPLSFKDELQKEVQVLIALLCFYFYYSVISFSFVICFISSWTIQHWPRGSQSGRVAIPLHFSLYTESSAFYL